MTYFPSFCPVQETIEREVYFRQGFYIDDNIMASTAKDRVSAIGKQLAPAVVETATYEGIPPIKQLAPASNGPRAQGKVVIITGAVYTTPRIAVISDARMLRCHPRRQLALGHRPGNSAPIRPKRCQSCLRLRL